MSCLAFQLRWRSVMMHHTVDPHPSRSPAWELIEELSPCGYCTTGHQFPAWPAPDDDLLRRDSLPRRSGVPGARIAPQSRALGVPTGRSWVGRLLPMDTAGDSPRADVRLSSRNGVGRDLRNAAARRRWCRTRARLTNPDNPVKTTMSRRAPAAQIVPRAHL